MKKMLSMLLVLAMALALVPAFAVADAAEPIVITAFIQGDPAWDWSQNAALKYMEEKTGIRIDPTGYVFANQEANTQKQLLLASGDYPEIFLTGDAAQFSFSEIMTYGVGEGMFVPLNEYIANNERLTELYELRPQYYSMHVAPDGNIYTICRFSECGHCRAASKLYINMDWLEKLGMEVPTTTEEYYNYLVAVKNGDLNGNGVADEIPLTGTGNWYNGLLGAFLEIDASNKTYCADIDGTITFQANTPEFKEALTWLNKLFTEGLVDQAAFTQDGTQFKQTVGNDPTLAGAFNGAIYSTDMQNAYTYWNYRAIAPLKGPAGVQYAVHNMFINMNTGGYFVITDKCANPQAAVDWVGAANTPEAMIVRTYGVEGHGWKYAEPGQKNVLGGDYIFEFLTTNETYDNETMSNGPALGFVEHRASWSPALDEQTLYTASNLFEARIETETADLYVEHLIDPIPGSFFLEGDETGEYQDLKTTIGDYVSGAAAQFITGAKSLDADWDAYVADLDAYGVARYVELLQKGYDSIYGAAE